MGSYCVLIPCLTRPRITRSVTRSVPTRVASARPCVSNKKSARPAWQLRQALDGYSLSLPKPAINRSASNLDRIKNQAIAKQSGCVHTTCANVRTPSQFVCCVDCAHLQIAKFWRFLCLFVQVRETPVCATLARKGVATAIEVGEWCSPRLWDVIRALDHTIWLHLRPTFIKGMGRDQGFWVVDLYEGGPRSGVSGARTLRGGGHRHRMITILIHSHVRST